MKILDWWRARLRGEQHVLVGGATLGLVLIAVLLLQPVVVEQRRLYRELPLLHADLAWMQAQLPEIHQLHGAPTAVTNTTLSPAAIEVALSQLAMQEKPGTLRPGEGGAVELAFDNVSYTSLVTLLHQLRVQQGVTVGRARIISKDEKPGMVMADLLLTPAK